MINKLLRLQKYINEIAELLDLISKNKKTLLYVFLFFFFFFLSFFFFFLSDIHIDIA